METGLQISDEETKEQLGLVHQRQRLIPEELHLHLVSPPASVYSPHRLILWPSYAVQSPVHCHLSTVCLKFTRRVLETRLLIENTHTKYFLHIKTKTQLDRVTSNSTFEPSGCKFLHLSSQYCQKHFSLWAPECEGLFIRTVLICEGQRIK